MPSLLSFGAPTLGDGPSADAYATHYVSRTAEAPRVLMYSARNAAQNRAFVTHFEFEDVINELDAVHMIAPRHRTVSEVGMLGQRVVNMARRKLLKRREVAPFEPYQLPDGPFDLFFGVFYFPSHLGHLDALPGWRQRARKAVAYIIEGWSKELPGQARFLPMLDQFDQVFVLNRSSIEMLRQYTTAPIAFMPTALDMERFCPHPIDAPRVVDCYSYGRRSPVAHAQMLELARRERFYYIYDTLGLAPIPDFRAHRELLANTLKRSRYTTSYSVNTNRVLRTGGEEVLTTRYFEGAAAGALQIGSPTPVSEFHECFDWPDAVIDFPYEPADVRAEFAALDAQPERLAAARRAGIVNSLRRHDWLYRWRQVLDATGLGPTEAMHARAERLDRLIELAGRAPHDMATAASGGGDGVTRAAVYAADSRVAAGEPVAAGATGVGALRPAIAPDAQRGMAWNKATLFTRGGTRRCPNCTELVQGDATACPFCGQGLGGA